MSGYPYAVISAEKPTLASAVLGGEEEGYSWESLGGWRCESRKQKQVRAWQALWLMRCLLHHRAPSKHSTDHIRTITLFREGQGPSAAPSSLQPMSQGWDTRDALGSKICAPRSRPGQPHRLSCHQTALHPLRLPLQHILNRHQNAQSVSSAALLSALLSQIGALLNISVSHLKSTYSLQTESRFAQPG